MSFLIGLVGPAKVGKTTTARALVQGLKDSDPGLVVGHAAFADQLYGVCSFMTGIPVETLSDQAYKEVEWTEETAPLPCLVGWTPRKMLQKVGTEGIRSVIHPDFWAQCGAKAASNMDITIMADARFENEYKLCDFVIELSREGVEYACNHPSAMPPPTELIDFHIDLYPDIIFDTVVKIILDKYSQTLL